VRKLDFTDLPSFSGSRKRTLLVTEKLHSDEVVALGSSNQEGQKVCRTESWRCGSIGRTSLCRFQTPGEGERASYAACLLRATDTIAKSRSFSSKIGKRVRVW
jgi:hypothetical protein